MLMTSSGDGIAEIIQLKKSMADEFEIKDLGTLKYFFGMEVARSNEGISYLKRKYTLDLLIDTGMLGYHPVDTPIEFNHKLGNSGDKEQYQRLPVHASSYEEHIEAVNRIFRSKKQGVVARSSVEIEYKAMSLGICEEIRLQKVLYDLHHDCPTPDIDIVLSVCLESDLPTVPLVKSGATPAQVSGGPVPTTSDLSGSSKSHAFSNSSLKHTRDKQSGKRKDYDRQEDNESTTVQSQPLPKDFFRIRQIQKARGATSSQTGSASYGSAISGDLSGSTG
ncbi:cleavage stimulation factor subunit 77 isoform X1 [Cucumis melo var. makuwa]|uniref:Cleavage stimulation factor subunit 77 isoform X1 n=1 Tax=Cucumis melo var. makuwa TaxID=1194695 RepID=A0A5D3C2E5_CUCMM|nr:cleavage stimulation factor subunit 77 isoform X1 [Cucumis melo var. makuwa]TYK05368.1 cleavage stimulation factor subunit 77 isoform X1 [Cucumis melo var. makuwa]